MGAFNRLSKCATDKGTYIPAWLAEPLMKELGNVYDHVYISDSTTEAATQNNLGGERPDNDEVEANR